jgi:hypothetical protein
MGRWGKEEHDLITHVNKTIWHAKSTTYRDIRWPTITRTTISGCLWKSYVPSAKKVDARTMSIKSLHRITYQTTFMVHGCRGDTT